ncbi:hypothetical protein GIB67_012583 [Kingdonia uniflora]|uniref:Uncharacterized protein n=1 Tax=Kingdonia uniflora TaxID=39325 RepID=A0A7J7NES2_9MAGN|nr:hypothetical protein GIB67_012583 [Kingdonia uniflora]
MVMLQFKDDCDGMKVGLCEFDSSWKWQASELKAISTVTVSYSQVPQVLSKRVKFEAEIHRRLNSRAAKSLCDSKEECIFWMGLQISSSGCPEETPQIYQKLKAIGQYPDEKADSRFRMKVQSPRTSVGKGEVKEKVYGFGCDLTAKEYKVVQILYLDDSVNEINVYSLCDNSWRKIGCVPFKEYYLMRKHCVFLNGYL